MKRAEYAQLSFGLSRPENFDPRDSEDRWAQASALGVGSRRSCQTRCSCPIGVRIHPSATVAML